MRAPKSWETRLRLAFALILPSLSLLILCLALPACTWLPVDPGEPATLAPTVMATTPQSPLAATRQATKPSPSASPAEPPATEAKLQVCSPLPGYSFYDLQAAISNPFNPPPPGSDDPHQGIDLAIQQNGLALAGGEVQAVIGGVVAGRFSDRFPYGTALLVETPLEDFGLAQLEQLTLPTPAPTLGPHSVLTCPTRNTLPFPLSEKRSLYILYAHLQEAVDIQPGGAVRCGQHIGRIGQSGNALNPHLHVEIRVGPAGARFSSLAHYTSSASAEEMSNYCLWRVSGVFQLVNPLQLLEKMP